MITFLLLRGTVRGTASSAVMTIRMLCHEDTSTTSRTRALLSQSGNLTIIINSVELECGELHTFVLVLDLLGGGVHFFLSLLSTSTKSEYKMKRSLLGDIVITESSSVLELYIVNVKYENVVFVLE